MEKSKMKIFELKNKPKYKIEIKKVKENTKEAYDVLSFIKKIYGYSETVEQLMPGTFNRPELMFIILRSEDKHNKNSIIALASKKKVNNVTWINNVGVDVMYRGCGLGKVLMLETMKGEKEVRLRAIKESVVDFYKTLGFKVVSYHTKEEVRGEYDAVACEYEKDLEGSWEMVYKV